MKSVTLEQCFGNFTQAFKYSIPSTPALTLSFILLYLLLILFFTALAIFLVPISLNFPELAKFIMGLIGNIFGIVVSIGMMNVACRNIFLRDKVSWKSALSILSTWNFFFKALGMAVIWILVYLAVNTVVVLLVFVLGGLGMALNSVTVPVLIGIILGIPLLVLMTIIGNGMMLGQYLLVPDGENESVFSAIAKGIQASFKNLSVTVASFVVTICVCFVGFLVFLPLLYMISHHASPGAVAMYMIPVAIIFITICYAYTCYFSLTGHSIFTDDTSDRKDNGNIGYSESGSTERFN